MRRVAGYAQPLRLTPLIRQKRCYHNPVGTFPVGDPRSIYDSRVQYLWLPSNRNDSRAMSKNTLLKAVCASLGIKSGWFSTAPEVKEIREICIKQFFVPYWIVVTGIYTAIDHVTMHQEYPEGRIAMDFTYSISGTSHAALKLLQFPLPATNPPDASVLTQPPLEDCVYVPFSVPPPLHHRDFLRTLGSATELMLTRNVKIRGAKAKVAAQPVLEPVFLGEYEFRGKHITAAHCPRLSTDSTRVFKDGKWTHHAEEIGPFSKAFEIAWQGANSKAITDKTSKEIHASLDNKIQYWSRKRPFNTATRLDDELWAGSFIGQEATDAIRSWRAAKLDLWKQGYELAS